MLLPQDDPILCAQSTTAILTLWHVFFWGAPDDDLGVLLLSMALTTLIFGSTPTVLFSKTHRAENTPLVFLSPFTIALVTLLK